MPASSISGLHGGQFEVPARGGLVQPLRGHRHPGELGEDRAQRAGGLALGRQEAAQIAAQLLGQGERGEGLGGRREVDDEQAGFVGARPRAGR